MVRIADLLGIIPSITGKIELVYEGEQEGPLNVAHRLLGLAIRNVFVQYFPDPQTFKKVGNQKAKANSYQSVIDWFGKGNEIELLQDAKDDVYRQRLYEVDGLHAAVKQFYPKADEEQAALLMEFMLHGLSEFSLISKKGIEAGGYSFADMLGSMLNISLSREDDEEDEEEDF
jgi:magnesium chelatase subunit I